MTNHSIPINPHQPNQRLLFPEHNPLFDLDDKVRTTEIGGEFYASILDIFEFHGGKKNPSQAWKTTLDNLERQGYSPKNGELTDYHFSGKGKRPTPMINLNGFLRVVQASEVKEWESIRVWLAKTGADAIRARATRQREHNIQNIDNSGLGDTIEARRYKARHENIETYKQLQAVIARVCTNPQIGILTNAEYVALFGETTDGLKKLLRTKSIRDSLNVTQLRTITYAEDTLRDILASKTHISNQQIESIIYSILPPIGDMLKTIMTTQGLDHVTGRPLLNNGA